MAAGSVCRPLMTMAADVPLLESRAIFDEGLSWVTKESAIRVLDRIKRAGFNVFVPNVWHGSGTLWASGLAPWDTRNVPIPGFDPLDNLIRVAETYDIEIHPWFTTTLRQREFLLQYYSLETPANAFDVHREDFREFFASLVSEVVLRYPVQGINLDYLITMGLCRCSSCIEDYRVKTGGRKLITDWNLRKFPGYGVEYLIAWQQDAMTDILRRVSSKVRAIRSDIIISVDATPGINDLKVQGENSIKWADNKLIDVLYNMDYQSSPDYARILSQRATMKRPEAVAMLCGNYEVTSAGVISRDAAKVAELLTNARSFGSGNGMGLYLYSRLSDAQIQTLATTVFKMPAIPKWTRVNVS